MLGSLRLAIRRSLDLEQAWLRLEAVAGPALLDVALAAVERYEADGVDRLVAINRVAEAVARYGYPAVD